MTETMSQFNEADEVNAAFYSYEEQIADRSTFGENLAWLLSQTRKGKDIRKIDITEDGIAHVVYKNNTEKQISVDGDSYIAIMYDIIVKI